MRTQISPRRYEFEKACPDQTSQLCIHAALSAINRQKAFRHEQLLSGVPDYFGRNKISSGGDLSHYSSASLY